MNCKAHKIAIQHKKNRLGRYMQGKDCERQIETYHVFMERLSQNPWPELKQLLFDKMLAFLDVIKQTKATHHMLEQKANWMICDSGYASVDHNNGHETHQRNLRIGTHGLCGTKMHNGPTKVLAYFHLAMQKVMDIGDKDMPIYQENPTCARTRSEILRQLKPLFRRH